MPLYVWHPADRVGPADSGLSCTESACSNGAKQKGGQAIENTQSCEIADSALIMDFNDLRPASRNDSFCFRGFRASSRPETQRPVGSRPSSRISRLRSRVARKLQRQKLPEGAVKPMKSLARLNLCAPLKRDGSSGQLCRLIPIHILELNAANLAGSDVQTTCRSC